MRPEEGLVPLHHLEPTVQRAEFPFALASEGTYGTACDGQVPQTCSGISTDCTLVAGPNGGIAVLRSESSLAEGDYACN